MFDVRKVLRVLESPDSEIAGEEREVANVVLGIRTAGSSYEKDCTTTVMQLRAAKVTSDQDIDFSQYNLAIERRQTKRVIDFLREEKIRLESSGQGLQNLVRSLEKQVSEQKNELYSFKVANEDARRDLLVCQKRLSSEQACVASLRTQIEHAAVVLEERIAEAVENRIRTVLDEHKQFSADAANFASTLGKLLPLKLPCPVCSGRGHWSQQNLTISDGLNHTRYLSSVTCSACNAKGQIDNPARADLARYQK
jgi:hypothetical protein